MLTIGSNSTRSQVDHSSVMIVVCGAVHVPFTAVLGQDHASIDVTRLVQVAYVCLDGMTRRPLLNCTCETTIRSKLRGDDLNSVCASAGLSVVEVTASWVPSATLAMRKWRARLQHALLVKHKKRCVFLIHSTELGRSLWDQLLERCSPEGSEGLIIDMATWVRSLPGDTWRYKQLVYTQPHLACMADLYHMSTGKMLPFICTSLDKATALSELLDTIPGSTWFKRLTCTPSTLNASTETQRSVRACCIDESIADDDMCIAMEKAISQRRTNEV
jgi:hypothetical protein